MSPFSLSTKSIKTYTSKQLNYELTSNAFEFLNEYVKTIDTNKEENVNAWLKGILNEAKDLGKKIIKRKDIEMIVTENHEHDLSANVSIEESGDDEWVEDPKDLDSPSEFTYSTRSIEINQLSSMCQSEEIQELESEIERLKKIIQIILNKQAELAWISTCVQISHKWLYPCNFDYKKLFLTTPASLQQRLTFSKALPFS